jgi:hypothetical protein
VACVIFTKAKTARGTIARRGVLEKEKNEPRDMPSPALAFMQWPAEDRQNRINRSNTSLVLRTADHNEIDKLMWEFERPARLRTAAKNMQSRLLPSSTISCARMRKE